MLAEFLLIVVLNITIPPELPRVAEKRIEQVIQVDLKNGVIVFKAKSKVKK